MANMITGTDSGETLAGTAGDDEVSALGGNDIIVLSRGHDLIDGGSGDDQIRVVAASLGIPAGPRGFSITGNRISDSWGGLDTSFSNVERLLFSDTSGYDVMLDASGFAGNFLSVSVRGGNSSLIGGASNDSFSLSGGTASIDGASGNDSAFIGVSGGYVVEVSRSGDKTFFNQLDIDAVTARNVEIFALFSTGPGGLNVDASGIDAPMDFFTSGDSDVIVGTSGRNVFRDADSAGAEDVYAGFGGADRYVFSSLTGVGRVTIVDLDADDEIDLSAIAGAKSFIGTNAFTGVAGQYRYYVSGGETFLAADANGDGTGDWWLTIANDAFFLGETAPGSNVIRVTGEQPDPNPGPDDVTGTEGDDYIDTGAGDDVIGGRGGNDTINAGPDKDRVDGGDGNDTINGDEGDDAIDGGAGNDTINGGDGDDRLDGGSGQDSVFGDDGNDTLTGTGGGDWLMGGLGDDILTASFGSFNMFGDEGGSTEEDGNDRLTLTNGGSQSWLDGGGGDDIIFASGKGVVIVGGGTGHDDISIEGYANGNVNLAAGNDVLRLAAGFFTLNVDTGQDTIVITAANAGFMTIIGFSAGEQGDRLDLSIYGADPFGTGTLVMNRNGPDVYFDHPATGMRYVMQNVLAANLSAYNLGVPNPAYAPQGLTLDDPFAANPEIEWPGELVGADGADLIRGHGGEDYLLGSGGNDRLEGGTGADRLDGGSGDDSLDGGGGNDALAGGIGDDSLAGGGGADLIAGGTGVDLLNGGAGADTLDGGGDQDWLTGGTEGDTASGGLGHDSVWGEAGDDLLDGGAGDDTIDGGAGNDTVTYAAAASRVEIDLSWLEDQLTRGAGVDTLVSIENAIGSAFGDALAGNAGANRLTGGGGADLLTGGAGNDMFVLLQLSDSAPSAPDLVADLARGDRLDLSALDADSGAAGDQAFHLGTTPGRAGDIGLAYDAAAGRTAVNLYVDGDAVPDAVIWLAGNQLSLGSADFIF